MKPTITTVRGRKNITVMGYTTGYFWVWANYITTCGFMQDKKMGATWVRII